MRAALILLAMLAAILPAQAQQASQLASTNQSILITTANTYQAITVTNQPMRSLTIQNNNTTADNCFIGITGLVAAGMTTTTPVTPPNLPATTAIRASILLQPGQSYSRYWPHIPLGPIVGTCAVAGDSIYVDWQ
jgi:hypothetical protein